MLFGAGVTARGLLGGAGRAAWGGFKSSPTAIGAAMGGTYGAFSDNTSILGGIAMGAIGGRYGMGAMRGMQNRLLGTYGMLGRGERMAGLRNLGAGAMTRVGRMLGQDFGRARQATNNGYNKIRGLWR